MLLVLVLAATPLEIAQEWETRGDDGKAIAELTAAVTKDPAWSIGRVELGRLQLKQGLSDTALENLDIARALAPENPRAHYLFALAASFWREYEALVFATAVALLLCLFFNYRFVSKSRKFMPSGLLAVISLVVLGLMVATIV